MNNQNVVRIKATTDGKYKRMYQDHIERDEFEFLNKRTAERVAKMRKALWEQEAKAAMAQVKQEKKFNGILNLVTVILFCIVAIAALCALSYTDNLDWAITAIVVALLALCGAFRAGYIWHEIKF
jgi:predicted membrane channel-forming protein YqfA (hemolysin III family)